LPILDEDGRDWSIDVGIPSSGVLTMVLLNRFLDEFDRAFIRYARYVHEIFVALPMSSSKKVSLEDIQTLFKVQDPRLAYPSDSPRPPSIRLSLTPSPLTEIEVYAMW
jgi:hypothetical protein